MNLDRGYLKSNAKNALSGKWGLSIAVMVVYGLLTSGGSFFNSILPNNNSNSSGDEIIKVLLKDIPTEVIFAVLAILMVIVFAQAVISGALTLGLNLYFIKLNKGEPVTFSTLFSLFKYILKAFGLQLYMGLFILLWSLLLFIPGIIASYRYSMATYIMAENPEIGIQEAVNKSKEMMKGYKGDLWVLDLSFIGWAILSVITCFIGLLWLSPYIEATRAAFYLEVSGQNVTKYENYGVTPNI